MINNIKTLEQLKDFINSSDSFGYNACDVVKDYANKNGLRVESEGACICVYEGKMRLEYSDDGACLFDGAPVMRTEEEEKIVAEAFAMFGCNESIE